MDLISERALWFVLGLLAGWLSVWLVVTTCMAPAVLPGILRNAELMASERTRYLPSFTDEMAYMTTKKANSRVMKSAYETSQRSWFSCSSSCRLRAMKD